MIKIFNQNKLEIKRRVPKTGPRKRIIKDINIAKQRNFANAIAQKRVAQMRNSKILREMAFFSRKTLPKNFSKA